MVAQFSTGILAHFSISIYNLCIILTPKNNPKYPINVQFYNIYLNAIRKRIVNELADGTSKLTISADDLMNYYVEYFHIDKHL